eukprot:TRINITY_DN34250_c0_g1_i1.p3 TRINITY_DN34250_c0_g1~~TRINITY_DN34250_c0_g1_i1.p3  ORF type:complete len:181 (+),score=18.54 TRINITY_DN34250_c0_g1_i1:130-672(+)
MPGKGRVKRLLENTDSDFGSSDDEDGAAVHPAPVSGGSDGPLESPMSQQQQQCAIWPESAARSGHSGGARTQGQGSRTHGDDPGAGAGAAAPGRRPSAGGASGPGTSTTERMEGHEAGEYDDDWTTQQSPAFLRPSARGKAGSRNDTGSSSKKPAPSRGAQQRPGGRGRLVFDTGNTHIV